MFVYYFASSGALLCSAESDFTFCLERHALTVPYVYPRAVLIECWEDTRLALGGVTALGATKASLISTSPFIFGVCSKIVGCNVR